jgi:hypothetical protein
MKALNTIRFIANASEDLTKWVKLVEEAKTYEDARKNANVVLGYLDCMTTFCNTMICKENNDLTPEISDMIDEWKYKLYQAACNVADRTEQPREEWFRLAKLRDEAFAAYTD